MNLVKLQDTKVNIQKSLEFLYSNNEKSEREIKEINPFTTISKRIKYRGTNLPKETKDLYCENYKTLMKETEDDTDGKIHHVLGLCAVLCSVTLRLEESILLR